MFRLAKSPNAPLLAKKINAYYYVFLRLFNEIIRIFENIVGEIFDRCAFSEGFHEGEGLKGKKKTTLRDRVVGCCRIVLVLHCFDS
jgi:hypothetical protein